MSLGGDADFLAGGIEMDLKIRRPQTTDLQRIMAIEKAGFTPDEAATDLAMAERIEVIPDTFLIAENTAGKIVGYVVGPVIPQAALTDDLFEKTVPNPKEGGYIAILSLAVAPEFRHRGVGGFLLENLAAAAVEQKRAGITLTCLAELIPFYEKHGYENRGVSASQHAGEVWYDLVLVMA